MAGGNLGNNNFFSFFQSFGGKFGCKWVIKYLKGLNEGHLQFLAFKKVEIIENADTCTFSGVKSNNMSRNNNWKPLFEANFSKNSTKTIRLFALDFYEVIVDSAFGLINYHLIEISSS